MLIILTGTVWIIEGRILGFALDERMHEIHVKDVRALLCSRASALIVNMEHGGLQSGLTENLLILVVSGMKKRLPAHTIMPQSNTLVYSLTLIFRRRL